MSQAVDTIYQNLDLGTGSPTSVPMETIFVTITEGEVAQNFAKAFVEEGYRKAPLKATHIKLTVEELKDYVQYLLYQRTLSIQDECQEWRKLKNLWIPAFIQYVLSTVGKVVDRQFGLTIIPKAECPQIMENDQARPMTYADAVVISEKIAGFEAELQMVQDAMPRGKDGDVDVMSTALIANYVRSMRVVGHVSATYVAAFLNLKLQQEEMFKALYRVQYDDLGYIAQALTTSKIL